MLEIRPLMNSTCDEVLGFKTCCGLQAFDQNLEIHVENTGFEPVTVPSHFDLIGDEGTRRVTNVMPGVDLQIAPGETRAFYCMMDEDWWEAARELRFYDTDGRPYGVALSGTAQQ